MIDRMTFWEHVDELRYRLILCLLFFIFLSIISYFFSEKIFLFISAPLKDLNNDNFQQIFSTLTGPFLIYISIALFSGCFLSFPVFIYNILRFLYPAIGKKSFLDLFTILIFCTILFLVGSYFAYYLLIPISLRFLISFNTDFDGISQLVSVNDYASFVVSIVFVAGLLFQLPIVAFFLAKLKIISSRFLKNKRRYAILVSFVLSAFITPPDIVSQFILAIPIILLYEICILITRFVKNDS